jgi:O-acetylserine/cysteine efflux transporter
MRFKHLMLATLVAIIWGCNFIFLRFSLEEIPPLTLCALRFFMSSIPLVFFVRRPDAPWGWLLVYSFLTFSLQFAFLFLGMQAGISVGLASLLAQVQVFFSFLFATLFLGERLTRWQVMGACTAFMGVALVLEHLGGGDITSAGFFWVLAAAIAWGAGNTCVKKMGPVQGVSLIIWANFLSFFPLFLASCWVDGPSAMWTAVHVLSWRGLVSLAYIVYVSTWVGYGLWAWLLSVYSVGMVVPFTLLVPVVGMLVSNLVLGESLPSWKLFAAVLILCGLIIHLFGARFSRFLKFGWRKELS